MSKVFGPRKGCNGYKWQDCANPKVLARVKKLHPVIFQHDPNDMPSILKIKFAEGIEHELVNGIGFVNCAAFAQEVNQTQRKQRFETRERLQLCQDNRVTKVSKDDMLKIKLETPPPSSMNSGSTSKKFDVLKVCTSRVPTK